MPCNYTAGKKTAKPDTAKYCGILQHFAMPWNYTVGGLCLMCTELQNAAKHYQVLQNNVKYCEILHNTLQGLANTLQEACVKSSLQCKVLRILQCIILPNSAHTKKWNTVKCCNTIQWKTLQCRTVQCLAISLQDSCVKCALHWKIMPNIAKYYKRIWNIAILFIVIQCNAVQLHCNWPVTNVHCIVQSFVECPVSTVHCTYYSAAESKVYLFQCIVQSTVNCALCGVLYYSVLYWVQCRVQVQSCIFHKENNLNRSCSNCTEPLFEIQNNLYQQ